MTMWKFTYVPDMTERFPDGLGKHPEPEAWTADDEYERCRDDEAELLAQIEAEAAES